MRHQADECFIVRFVKLSNNYTYVYLSHLLPHSASFECIYLPHDEIDGTEEVLSFFERGLFERDRLWSVFFYEYTWLPSTVMMCWHISKHRGDFCFERWSGL